MGQENVELVRRLYEAFKARDNAWPYEIYDSDIEWDVSGAPWQLEMGAEAVYRGHAGVRAWWRQWLEAWDSIVLELHDVIEAGDEVVAIVSQVNRGRASGAEVAFSYAQVWTLRGGKIVRSRLFADSTEALRAVGLQ